MSHSLSSHALWTPNLVGNAILVDEQKTLFARLPAVHVVALSVVVPLFIATVAWWAYRFVSLELTAVYAEAFRKAGLPE